MIDSPPDASSVDPKAPPGKYAWYVLAVLLAVYMAHHLDRQVFSLLQEPIKQEFGLTDGQLGFLSGSAYALAFGLAGLPLGFLADRTNRVRLLAVLITIWSGMTALGSLATSYAMLLAVRVGVGAAESGGTPANLSILTDYFRDRGRSTAVGIYLAGPYLGTLVGFVLTGAVASAFGWRAALLVAGLPGLAIMLVLITTVREPVRPLQDSKPSALATLRTIWADRTLVHIMAITTLVNVVAAGVASWTPSLIIRSHGLDLTAVGLALGLAVAPVAAIGTVLAGLYSDRLRARPHLILATMALAAFLIIPAIAVAALASSIWVALAALGVQAGLHAIVLTAGYGLALGRVTPGIRGTTSAVMQVASNLIAFGSGPLIVGLLSDALVPSLEAASLRYAIAMFAAVNLWTVLHCLLARRGVVREAPGAVEAATSRGPP